MVPLSYKAAWDAVDAMNNVSGATRWSSARPVGGNGGGNDADGVRAAAMISMYRAVRARIPGKRWDRLLDRVGEGRRPAICGSSRACYAGCPCEPAPVINSWGRSRALTEGSRGVEARIRIDDRNEISSLINAEQLPTAWIFESAPRCMSSSRRHR